MDDEIMECCESDVPTKEQILEGIEIIRDYPYEEEDEEH